MYLLQLFLQFLAFAAVLLCAVLLPISLVRLFHFFKAEQHLTRAMVGLAKRKQLFPALARAQRLGLHGQELSPQIKKEFSELLNEALGQLQSKERSLIMEAGIHQASAQGRKNYEFKLLSQTLKMA